MFEIVFDDSVDRSKTVLWYTEMDGTGQKDSVDYSDDEMAAELSVDPEDAYPVDMACKISSLPVYNCSVMVTVGEELQYLVEFKIYDKGRSIRIKRITDIFETYQNIKQEKTFLIVYNV